MGLQIRVSKVGTIDEIDAAFATFKREQPDALFVASDPFFRARRAQLALLAAHHRTPATYAFRDYAEAGGLMSYGASLNDAFRQVGEYSGRILHGAKPTELPVVQSSKFELVINLRSARTLGLTVPPSLLAIADEVMERSNDASSSRCSAARRRRGRARWAPSRRKLLVSAFWVLFRRQVMPPE